ncbi:hypothetical protein JCM10908_000262 [Rhodotorula pacifica]|uniref:copper metallochaperone ATX1 n=1 Tax=Rhodotorula pacifica TaxID=1495444 RepID=UPI0031747677
MSEVCPTCCLSSHYLLGALQPLTLSPLGSKATYKFNVVMTCSGCSGAIDRVLKKTEGVTSHDISLDKQEVLVKATVPYDDVLAKIKKTGKEVKSGEVVA